MKKILVFALALAALMGCSKPEPYYLSFSESSVNLVKGDTHQLTLMIQQGLMGEKTAYDLVANPQKVTLTSAFPGVVTVDSNGLLKANKSGSSIITASAEGLGSAKCQVNVKSAAELAEELKIGSYNLWVSGTGTDEWAWSLRKPILAQSIVENGFDIFGFQEAEATIRSQLPALVKNAGGNYEWWFVCRDNQAATSGEAVGIAYNPDKMTISDKHYFWLSETPDEMSYGWTETKYHRVAACATFTLKSTGAKFFFMATHGPLDDTASANVGDLFIAREKLYNTEKLPSFLVGVMNAHPTDALYVSLSTWWKDPVKELASDKESGPLGTFNGHNINRSMNTDNYRIDYVFYRGDGNHLYVTGYRCNDTKYQTTATIYPSDHLPIYITAKIY